MPGIRKVVTRSPFRRVGTVACPWFRHAPIEYESLLERDFIRLALLSLKVSAIFEQPFTLDLGDAGRYTPDFLLMHEHGPIVVEVKPSARASEAEIQSRLASAAKMLAGRNHRFMVATEDFIRADKRHDRAALILRQARSHLQFNVTSKVLAIASRRPDGITIRHLADKVGVPQSTVLHLVGRRQLRIGESLHIDEHQLVFPVEVIR